MMSSDTAVIVDCLCHMFSTYFVFRGITFGCRIMFRLISGE